LPLANGGVSTPLLARGPLESRASQSFGNTL
jgi:hypothetical protein